MAIDDRMTLQALNQAKLHVYNVCQQGSAVTLTRAATKDEMGAPLTSSELVLKAFPVRFNPYDREVMEKISWSENTDILCYISKLQLDRLSITIQDLRVLYETFKYDRKKYDVRYIEPYSAFAGDFLYVIIGGKS